MLQYIRKSVANRIVVLISLIFTATIIAIGLLTFQITYRELVDNKLVETELKAQSISKDVKGIFDEAKLVTQQLALHPEIKLYLKTAVDRRTVTENPYYEETLDTLVQTQKSGQVYYLAWVANEKANFYLDSLGIIPDETYDVKKRPWYQVGINAKDTAFTPPYIEWGTKRVVISCIKPMRENGQIYGFVVMDFILEKIPVIFHNAKINSTDKSFLLSAEGDYIFHEDADKIMNANIHQPEDELYPYLNWIEEPLINFKEVQYKGKAYYLEVYKVDENGWKVVSLIDKAAIQEEIRKIAWLIIGILGLIFMATLVLIHWTVKRTMEPFQNVLTFAKDIAAGELSKNIPESYMERADEMGALSKSFQIIIDAFRNENIVLEQKITEKNEELQQQYTFILEAEKAASLGHLVAGVAHEINTPVGVSLSTASYLKKVNDEHRQRLAAGQMNKENLKELMSVIDESARLLNTNLERAADLVKSFKQLAVDQSSGLQEQFELKDNIDSVILSLLHEYKHMPVKIENRCPEQVYLNTYPGALSQIFTNLIINSLHHGLKTTSDGLIEIDASVKPDWIILTYRDNGIGISEKNLKKIYEPFFTTKRHDGNSGLGMHIVMSLVTQKLKGNIRCESKEGEGVTFIMEFPRMLSGSPVLHK